MEGSRFAQLAKSRNCSAVLRKLIWASFGLAHRSPPSLATSGRLCCAGIALATATATQQREQPEAPCNNTPMTSSLASNAPAT
jgi:hypothetical protein